MRQIIALFSFLILSITTVWAADLNTATRAEIEAVRGVGVVLTDRILDQRKLKPFQNWQDALKRVKGLGKRNIAGFRDADMRIAGELPSVEYKGKSDKASK
jgi:competence protein ComEA